MKRLVAKHLLVLCATLSIGLLTFSPIASVPHAYAQNIQIGKVNFVTIEGARLNPNPPNATNIIGPTILPLSIGEYRMYFQARDSNRYANIMSATTTDGIHWTFDSGLRVLHGPTPSSIDWEAGEPDVIQGFNGTYLMPYTGRQQILRAPTGSFSHRIVFASSADSLRWTKDNYSFADRSQASGFAASADVIKVNSEYEMYYTGCCDNISGIFRAQSTNFVLWQTMGQVFEVGHDSSAIEVNGTYYMFFMAPPSFTPATPMNQDVLFLAVSADGINWSKEVYRMTLTNSSSGGTVDTSTLGDPAPMVAPSGSLFVYVNGPMGNSIIGIKPTSSLPKAAPQTTSTTYSSNSTTSSTTRSTNSTTTSVTTNTAITSSALTSTTTAIPTSPTQTTTSHTSATETASSGGLETVWIVLAAVAVVIIGAAVAYVVRTRRTRGPANSLPATRYSESRRHGLHFSSVTS